MRSRIQKITGILKRAGLTPSARWEGLSKKERMSVLIIDHAGKWKKFQESRERQAEMES